MTDNNPDDDSVFNIPKPGPTDFTIPSLDELKDKARKAQESIPKPAPEVRSFVARNRPILILVGGTYVLFRVNKRAIRKVVRRELYTALTNIPVKIDLGTYLKDLEAHEVTQRATWLAKHPY